VSFCAQLVPAEYAVSFQSLFVDTLAVIVNALRPVNVFHCELQALRRESNPANSLCEAMGGGKERVPPGCLSPGASLRVVAKF